MSDSKRPTRLKWRYASETVLLSLLLLGVFIYFLLYYGYFPAVDDWKKGLFHAVSVLLSVVFIGGGFGFWQGYKLQRRLDLLRDAMLHLEKGRMTHSLPPLGDDEIGQLGELIKSIEEKWKNQVNSLQRLSTHNVELAEKARYSAVIEERQRLARELHDAVSQQLFAISMTATAVSRTIGKDFEKARRQIELIEEMAAVAQSEMRALLLHLRPVHLEGKMLVEGLKELLAEINAKVPMDIDLEIDETIRLPKGIEDHLFRIVQEALSNTLRHSRATRMEIKMQKVSDAVKLLIRDNGVGFDMKVKKHTSYGIMTMRERVSEIGGHMNLVTAPGKGTRIDIHVPLLQNKGGDDHGGRTDQSADH